MDEAEQLLLRALEIQEVLLGPDDSSVGWTVSLLAYVCQALDRPHEAVEYAERAAPILEGGSPGDQALSDLLGALGQAYLDLERLSEAKQALSRAMAIALDNPDPSEQDLAWHRSNLALFHEQVEEFAAAEELLKRNLSATDSDEQPDPAMVAASKFGLGRIAQKQGRFAEAEPYLRAALEAREELWGADEPDLAYGYARLAEVLFELGKHEEVSELRLLALRLADGLSDTDPDRSELMDRLQRLDSA
jgi:tetratricopeptide (TPR) repeat protein